MQCLVCTGEARDLTPQNFDGYVIWVSKIAATTKSLVAHGSRFQKRSCPSLSR